MLVVGGIRSLEGLDELLQGGFGLVGGFLLLLLLVGGVVD